MSVNLSKLWVLILLTVCRLASGLCPLLVSRKFKRKRGFGPVTKSQVEKWVGYSMDFSGGLLLATCFVHMLPEVRDHLTEALQDNYKFPYAETLVCVGFFVVFVIEETVRHVAHHSLRPLDKAGALIPAKRRADGLPLGAARSDRELSPAATDLMAENCAANGASGGLAADAKFVVETEPTAKEGLALAECNNNTKGRRVHTLKNVLLVSALSFHSVMEGLAIGLTLDVDSLWSLFFAVSVHECTILLCVGIELVASCPSAMAVVTYMTFYALVSPAGVLCGTLMTIGTVEPGIEHSSLHMILVSSLQGLAAGTILYVTFFEVLNNNQHHHDHHHHRSKTNQSKSSILKLLFILIGFLFMVFLELLCKHEHKHSVESDHHSHGHMHSVNESLP